MNRLQIIILCTILFLYAFHLADDSFKSITAHVLERHKELVSLVLNVKDMSDIKNLPFEIRTGIIYVEEIEFDNSSFNQYNYVHAYLDSKILSLSNKRFKTLFVANKSNKKGFNFSYARVINKRMWLNKKEIIYGDKLNNIENTKYIVVTRSSKMATIYPIWFCDKNENVIDVILYYDG